jgi:predicted DNA-binding WGR domain protein
MAQHPTNTPRTFAAAAVRLPASASAWQLYEGAPVTVVRELNAALRAAAMDSGLKEAVKKAKKSSRDSWGDFSRSRLEQSTAWKELLSARYAAWRTHVQPVLNKHSEFGATDSEPYHVASGWLNRTIMDALGVTETFDRNFLLNRVATGHTPMNRTLVANVVARHLAANVAARHITASNVRVAHRPNLAVEGLTLAAHRAGMAHMLFFIDAVKNHSKGYEMLIAPDPSAPGMFMLVREWGALAERGKDRFDRKVMPGLTLQQAQREMNKLYSEKVGKGYKDAFKAQPVGQYPVGLSREVGFGWGTQAITSCVPALHTLVGVISEAVQAGDYNDAAALAEELDKAKGLVGQLESSMAREVMKRLNGPLSRLTGHPRFIPDQARTMKELKTLHTYLRRQLATCNVGPAPRTAASSVKLDNSTRQKINMALMKKGLDGNIAFQRIGQALNVIAGVLQDAGLEQAEVFSANRFMGDDGRANFDIALSNPTDSFSPTPINNTMLAITWHKHDSGRYEVIAYLS